MSEHDNKFLTLCLVGFLGLVLSITGYEISRAVLEHDLAMHDCAKDAGR